MEDTGRRAPVLGRIVQHALTHPIGADDGGDELVAVRRQGKRPRDAVAVEHKGLVRQTHRPASLVQVFVQKLLDAPVHRGLVVGEQALRLTMPREQGLGEIVEFCRIGRVQRRATERGELEVDVGDELGVGERRGVATEADGALEISLHARQL